MWCTARTTSNAVPSWHQRSGAAAAGSNSQSHVGAAGAAFRGCLHRALHLDVQSLQQSRQAAGGEQMRWS
jgi:hypothetical protein